jgi:predicted PurR-regulated permease PerM
LLLILAAVVREATGLIASVQSGEINLHRMFAQMLDTLPAGVKALLTRLGLSDLAGVQDSLSTSISDWVGANAPVMLSFGQNTVGVFVGLCVMLYLTFFLFRDGDELLALVKAAIPMERGVLEELLGTFTLVVRATVRGDILVALLQGSLGGLGFWVLGVHAAILWTVLMSFLSLFPVFGAALVWFPVALYFLSQGMIWQGIGLILYGSLVISLVDNIVRPWLVGAATRMPDYVVLMSTIGGITTFGMQGFITGPVVAAMFIAVWTTFLALPKG